MNGQPWYDSALICENGHLFSNHGSKVVPPKPSFCERCGARIIENCPSCDSIIRGYLNQKSAVIPHYVIPKFCPNCGCAYPWTSISIQVAKDYVDTLTGLPEEDRKQLKTSIDEIVRDTPRTELEATKFRTILLKTSKNAIEFFRGLLVEVAAEAAKKVIWP